MSHNKIFNMETTLNKPNSIRNIKLIAVASVFGCMGLICFILHVSPLKILEELANFAAHHYFFAGFVFLVICVVSLKFYFKQNPAELTTGNPAKVSRAAKRRALFARFRMRIGINHPAEESQYVKKEKIKDLRFSIEELLPTKEERANRNILLQKAMSLGNLSKQKVIICFKDTESAKHTIGTVWYADENHVSLKGGATIPVQCIYKVEI